MSDAPTWREFLADYEENGPMFLPVDDRLLRCRRHSDEPPWSRIQPCPSCAIEAPKRPDDIDIPEWWVPCKLPVVVREPGGGWHLSSHASRGNGLCCTLHHDREFALDEACVNCLEEDADAV